MLVKAFGSACCGIDALTVTIETDVSVGINFFLVGLPDSAVRESQQRIATAFETLGYRMPGRRVVINMAPADLRKEGSAYDLPLALSILAASEQLKAPELSSYVCMGELALDGSLRPVAGALSIALHAKAEGFKGCIFPVESAQEAATVEGMEIYGAGHLSEVIGFFSGKSGGLQPLAVPPWTAMDAGQPYAGPDFADVKGQEQAKRAIEIAAAGGHNLLMIGPPGAGKSFMAKCIPSILPPMTREEAMETTRIYSVSGRPGLVCVRPFRAPHHSASMVSLVGGGMNAMPGEISLAHHGVLYLDEIPEFSRHVLEVLRQPLEDRQITLARQRYRIVYPANFMLVASMNPCPCGYYGDAKRECSCAPAVVQRYMNRISGPLLDRIDLHVSVAALSADELLESCPAESSAAIRKRVLDARERQRQRLIKDLGIFANAQMGRKQIQGHCKLSASALRYLKQCLYAMELSARAYDRVLKVARTIADLAGRAEIEELDIAEAVQYRMN
jgi:Mg chelatase-related protein